MKLTAAHKPASDVGRLQLGAFRRRRGSEAAPRPIRWTARQRAAVVLAVASGRLAPGELECRYGISSDEFHDW
jgi:Protein of unknown function (DUF1153)